jgi:hypothetical protein
MSKSLNYFSKQRNSKLTQKKWEFLGSRQPNISNLLLSFIYFLYQMCYLDS